MRRTLVRAPGTGGIVTDRPAWSLGPEQAQALVDGIDHQGLIRQRRGWAYHLPTGPELALADSIGRYRFTMPNVTRTLMTVGASLYGYDGSVWWKIGFGAAGKTPTPPRYIPRAQYRDEVLLCDQSGHWPMLRYGGGLAYATYVGAGVTSGVMGLAPATIGVNATMSDGKETLTAAWGTPFSGIPVGAFATWAPPDGGCGASIKIKNATSTVLSLETLRASGSTTLTNALAGMWGTAWPGVEVYDAGTVTIASGAITGNGTGWTGQQWGSVYGASATDDMPYADAIRVTRASTWTMHHLNEVTGAAAAGLATGAAGNNITDAQYAMCRRLPFADVAVHNECLWGTGVAQHPTRVYYSPPNWNPAMPPEVAPPGAYNLAMSTFYEPRAGLLRYVNVPGDFDGNPIVALLSSDGPLLVLKRQAAYGIYGNWPSFTQQMVAPGAGCIDLRSACSAPGYGAFWAGENGIYGYRAGKVVDMTAGKINQAWRALMRRYNAATGSYVSCGIVNNHLIVSAYVTISGNTSVTYALNIGTGAWSQLTNFSLRAMQAPVIPGENSALLAVRNSTESRPINVAPAVDMSGTARDADGTSPALALTTGSGTTSGNDPDAESRLLDVSVTARIGDGATKSTALTVTATSRDALDQGQDTSASVTAGTITDSTSNARHRMRVGTAGRQHTLTIQSTATASDNTEVVIEEIGFTTRERRVRK